jgi:hypothetical protein
MVEHAEVKRIKKTLEERRPVVEAKEKIIAEEEARWTNEIASLESRIYTEAIEIDLGNGASIAIRTCMTASEGEKLDSLEKAQAIETDSEKKEEIVAEMISIVTLNPLITKEWILGNKDKYSPSDVLRVLLGFMEVRVQERAERIKKIQSASAFLGYLGRS